MGKHDKLPPIPSDEELAELAAFAAEHPDERSTESEVADGEKIQIPLKGFGSPTAGYGGLNAGQIATQVNMIEDGLYAEQTGAERKRLDDEGVP
jgi:hypothetical protein